MIDDLDLLLSPYNDNAMEYNYNENRYVLTVDGANLSNLDLVFVMGDAETTNQYLDLLSRTIYSIFLQNTDSKYHDKKLWLLSHSKHYREIIQKIFMDIIWYNYRSGGFMTIYQSGINMNEMKVFDLTVKNAMGVIGNNMAQVGGINERTLRYRISLKTDFETLDDLKYALIDKNIFTAQELEDIDSYKDIPQLLDYSIYKNLSNKLVLEDFTYWSKQLRLKGREW